MYRCRLLVALVTSLNAFAFADESPPAAVDSPVEAEDSIAHMETHPDVLVELVACEPAVIDPVAIRFDEMGRLWVVQMRDYPLGSPEGHPTSQIKLLLDEDSDGFYETAHLFADNLTFANGIEPWRGGVIVTSSGKVQWMKDTDGDHKVDVTETWFTGFAEENTQLRANDPTFALDNHIYISNGLRGGVVVAAKEEWKAVNPEPIELRGRDFRFDPLTGKAEAVTGNGQFGQTFDALGNRFVCTNRNPAKHIVFQQKELERNPHLAAVETVQDVATPGEQSRVFPITNAWTTSNLHAGTFTAACGVTVYGGTALLPQCCGDIFTCDPTGSFVHREVPQPAGTSFISRPDREGVEFLASRDPWFRPVNLENGPDGGLYVVDMYRAVIEHPQFMPDELKNSPDHRKGDDRGRIYRIRSNSLPRPPNRLPLTADSVEALAGDSWHRLTVQRLITETRDEGSIKTVQGWFSRNAEESEVPPPLAIIHGLHTLNGVGALPDEILKAELRKPLVNDVTTHAVRLVRPRLADSPELQELLIERVMNTDTSSTDDARDRMLLESALALGDIERSPKRDDALLHVFLSNPDDQWLRLACLSAIGDQSGEWVPRLMKAVMLRESVTGAHLTLLSDVATCAGTAGNAEQVAEIVSKSAQYNSPVLQLTIVDGLESGLERRGSTMTVLARQVPALAESLERLAENALQTLEDQSFRTDDRFALQGDRHRLIVRLLGIVQSDFARAALLSRLDATSDATEQTMLLTSLSKHNHEEVTDVLLTRLPGATPVVRNTLLDAVLRDAARIRAMYARIDAGEINPRILDVTTLQRLSRSRDAEIAGRATQIIEGTVDRNRAEVVAKYMAQLRTDADPERGRALFKQHCSVCHRVGGLGTDVAPDISDSRTKTHEYLLTHILDPNRVVDAGYFGYTIVTTDGRSAVGVIAAESATSLTLKQAEGKTITVQKDAIEECVSSGLSLMPVGLEKAIPPDDMSAVVGFLKNWRYLSGESPKPVE